MLINEVCKECKLTKKAVEYYCEQGLISPITKENGYRHFSEPDVVKLKKVAILRGLGLSIPDIRTCLEENNNLSVYKILDRRENEIAALQEKHELFRQLIETQNWQEINEQLTAIEAKQTILNRLLAKFPGYYGKFLSVHFAHFLGEPIKTTDHRDAFNTVCSFLDGVKIAIPIDLQEYLDDLLENYVFSITQVAAESLDAAIKEPKKYIQENKDMIEQYLAFTSSEEYKASPAYRFQELIRQFNMESGYNSIFIPAMKRLSPEYRKYMNSVEVANSVFLEGIK